MIRRQGYAVNRGEYRPDVGDAVWVRRVRRDPDRSPARRARATEPDRAADPRRKIRAAHRPRPVHRRSLAVSEHAPCRRAAQPLSHARIVSIDVAAAQAMDGSSRDHRPRRRAHDQAFSAGSRRNIPFYCWRSTRSTTSASRSRWSSRRPVRREDAIEAIVARVRRLPPVVRILDALRPDRCRCTETSERTSCTAVRSSTATSTPRSPPPTRSSSSRRRFRSTARRRSRRTA